MAEDGFGGDIAAAQRQLRQVEQAIIAAMPAAVKAGAAILKPEAVNLSPVRTRHLIGTVEDAPVEADNSSATHRVFVKAFYASYQEYGTSKMAAQPFLRPAAELRQNEIEEAMGNVIRAAAGEAILSTRGVMNAT